jgi:glutathionylspermidine synthase
VRRVPSEPRPDWLALVEGQGLTYAVDRAGDGDPEVYWDESAYYELSEDEVDHLEQVTDELHEMAMQAVARMVADPTVIERHGLPPGTA